MRRAFVLLALSVTLALPLSARGSDVATGPGQGIGAACKAPAFRQFDFWLGRWSVTNPAGKVVGHSHITRLSQGCAVHEHWFGQSGIEGNSLNYYDATSGQWHQDWVGGGGQILHLHGGLQGKAMVLSGSRTDPRGALIDRITWTPLSKHRVSQHWEISRDAGKTWKTVFLGLYTPLASTASP